MSDHHNVFENASTDEDVARNQVRIVTKTLQRREIIELAEYQSIEQKFEEWGFNMRKPISMTEDAEGNRIYTQEQT